MDIRQAILNRVDEVLADARKKFPTYANAPRPTVEFFEKGRAAGTALGYTKLRFNLGVFRQNPEYFIKRTVSHEIAHIVCSYTGLGRNHDRGWKRVDIALGGNGSRCWNTEDSNAMPVMVRQRKRYEHRATCGTIVMLSDVRHNKLIRGYGDYVVNRTGGRLNRSTFTGVVK